MKRIGKEGFSIVELALAMLVTGVGLMGVFALFPSGSESNRRAIQETQVGLFAEYVFNGFRYQAEGDSWAAVTNLPSFRISPLASGYAWYNPSPIYAGDGEKVVVYRARLDNSIEEMAFRYKLEVFPVAGRTNTKALVLNVWHGQYGVLTNGTTFYTEVFNYGGN